MHPISVQHSHNVLPPDRLRIVDPVQAAPLLRDAGEIEVGSFAERRWLLDLMAVRLPPVRVRGEERRAAA